MVQIEVGVHVDIRVYDICKSLLHNRHCEVVINKLESILSNRTISAFPDWDCKFALTLGASVKALGAVLEQQ